RRPCHPCPTTSERAICALHDALPIFAGGVPASGTSASPDSSGTPRVLVSARDAGGAEGLGDAGGVGRPGVGPDVTGGVVRATGRSGEDTSELQSRENLLCRLLLGETE